jgi:hypothetical protein
MSGGGRRWAIDGGQWTTESREREMPRENARFASTTRVVDVACGRLIRPPCKGKKRNNYFPPEFLFPSRVSSYSSPPVGNWMNCFVIVPEEQFQPLLSLPERHRDVPPEAFPCGDNVGRDCAGRTPGIHFPLREPSPPGRIPGRCSGMISAGTMYRKEI